MDTKSSALPFWCALPSMHFSFRASFSDGEIQRISLSRFVVFQSLCVSSVRFDAVIIQWKVAGVLKF